MARPDGRKPDELRPLSIERGYTESAPGSVLIRAGRTVVLCTACFEKSVPKWREGSGSGWVTAEYDMLPGATNTRRSRNRGKIDGRTQEIQRLIGRSLRSVVAMDRLGENSILLDCDVLQADGGTRTASVTGAFVALSDCVRYARRQKLLSDSPILEHVAAVSVGIVDGRAVLDLDYVEDSAADVDMNVVMTGANRFVEVQGTGEGATFDERQLSRMVKLAARGVRSLIKAQEKALRKRVV